MPGDRNDNEVDISDFFDQDFDVDEGGRHIGGHEASVAEDTEVVAASDDLLKARETPEFRLPKDYKETPTSQMAVRIRKMARKSAPERVSATSRASGAFARLRAVPIMVWPLVLLLAASIAGLIWLQTQQGGLAPPPPPKTKAKVKSAPQPLKPPPNSKLKVKRGLQ